MIGRFRDHVCMSILLVRAWMDPARFVERAGWHVSNMRASSLLISASRYVDAGEEIPKWLIG